MDTKVYDEGQTTPRENHVKSLQQLSKTPNIAFLKLEQSNAPATIDLSIGFGITITITILKVAVSNHCSTREL